jgi:hypothetical protein
VGVLSADACVNVHCEFGARCEAGECVCPEDCHSSNSESVCASDDRTYGSECEMQRAACSVSQELSVVFYGECKESLGKYISSFFAIPIRIVVDLLCENGTRG